MCESLSGGGEPSGQSAQLSARVAVLSGCSQVWGPAGDAWLSPRQAVETGTQGSGSAHYSFLREPSPLPQGAE